jgi:hypothetical protein
VAQAKGKISETDLQIIQIDQELRSEVAKELREIQAKAAELVEKRVAAEDQLNASTYVRRRLAWCISRQFTQWAASSHRVIR